MMAWVASVVWVTWQTVCGVVMASVRNEKGCGGSSPCCTWSASQAIVRPSRRGGVPVLSRPMRKSEPVEPLGEAERRRLADAAGRDLALADMDEPAQEGAGGEHHGAGADAFAAGGDDAGHGALLDDQVLDGGLDHFEARRGADRRLHGLAVELAVGLGARALDRRALAAVEHAELDAGGVGHAAHEAVERIDLAHEMALAETADGGVAGHLADGGEAVGDQRRARAHAGRGRSRLAAGMAAADDDDVEDAASRLASERVFMAPHLMASRLQRPLFHVNQTGLLAARSFADAELGEDGAQAPPRRRCGRSGGRDDGRRRGAPRP